ncbi:hypothetical protein PIB30_108318, partial [Stylosanthes scabra]|nr:hypothetical protein [Stylosanthes scabra]
LLKIRITSYRFGTWRCQSECRNLKGNLVDVGIEVVVDLEVVLIEEGLLVFLASDSLLSLLLFLSLPPLQLGALEELSNNLLYIDIFSNDDGVDEHSPLNG